MFYSSIPTASPPMTQDQNESKKKKKGWIISFFMLTIGLGVAFKAHQIHLGMSLLKDAANNLVANDNHFEKSTLTSFEKVVIAGARNILDGLPESEVEVPYVTDEMILEQAKKIGFRQPVVLEEDSIAASCDTCTGQDCLKGCELDVVIEAIALLVGILPVPGGTAGRVVRRLLNSLPPPLRRQVADLVKRIGKSGVPEAIQALLDIFFIIFSNGDLGCAFAGMGILDYLLLIGTVAGLLASFPASVIVYLAVLTIDIIALINSVIRCFG